MIIHVCLVYMCVYVLLHAVCHTGHSKKAVIIQTTAQLEEVL